MASPTIYDPSQDDSLGKLRGGGRVVQILRENLSDDARFIDSLSHVSDQDTLLIPLWRPFQKPLLSKRIAQRQFIMIFDVIPFKYPEHFPSGFRGRWRMYQNIRSLRNFDGIITISEESKKDIVDYLDFDPARVHVVLLTTGKTFFAGKGRSEKTNAGELRTRYGLPKKPFCVYIGDSNWNKNLITMAQAVIRADVKLVSVGRPFGIINELRTKDAGDVQDFFASDPLINHVEQHDFKEFIKLTLRDEEHFYFPGYVPDADLKQIFQQATGNILLSHDEGFGLSYLEAATQACPSILSDIPVFRELAGEAALFADPESIDAVARHIRTLVDMKRERSRLSAAALAQSKKYGRVQFRKSLLQILQEG